jgi:hypothetical protein
MKMIGLWRLVGILGLGRMIVGIVGMALVVLVLGLGEEEGVGEVEAVVVGLGVRCRLGEEEGMVGLGVVEAAGGVEVCENIVFERTAGSKCAYWIFSSDVCFLDSGFGMHGHGWNIGSKSLHSAGRRGSNIRTSKVECS